MKYKLSIRRVAAAEMQEAHDFYEQEQSGLGYRFELAVVNVLEEIAENPLQFPWSGVGRYRKAVVEKFPFCVYYIVEADKVVVLAIHDARRDPARWQAREGNGD